MNTQYRPGFKNVAAGIGVSVFSGACLFYMVFIRPLSAGDPAGGHTGREHTALSIILTYAGFAFVFLFASFETVMMIRKRRRIGRAKVEPYDTE